MPKIDLKIDEILAGLEDRLRRLEVSVAEELAGQVHPVWWDGSPLCDLITVAYGGYNLDQPYQSAVLERTEVEPGVWMEAEALEDKIEVLIVVRRGLRTEQKKFSVSRDVCQGQIMPNGVYLSVVEWEAKMQEAYRWCVLAIGQQRRLAMDRLLQKEARG